MVRCRLNGRADLLIFLHIILYIYYRCGCCFRLDDHFSLLLHPPSDNMQFIHIVRSICLRSIFTQCTLVLILWQQQRLQPPKCIILASTETSRHVRSNTQDIPYHFR